MTINQKGLSLGLIIPRYVPWGMFKKKQEWAFSLTVGEIENLLGKKFAANLPSLLELSHTLN